MVMFMYVLYRKHCVRICLTRYIKFYECNSKMLIEGALLALLPDNVVVASW